MEKRSPQIQLSLLRQAVGSDVPSLPVRHEEIAALAYAKYLNRQDWRGAVDHWLEAERELRCEKLARIAVEAPDLQDPVDPVDPADPVDPVDPADLNHCP